MCRTARPVPADIDGLVEARKPIERFGNNQAARQDGFGRLLVEPPVNRRAAQICGLNARTSIRRSRGAFSGQSAWPGPSSSMVARDATSCEVAGSACWRLSCSFVLRINRARGGRLPFPRGAC